MKKKILVIGSSRATFGYKKELLKILKKSKEFDLYFVVTGMHLSKEHGFSVDEIKNNNIKINKKIKIPIKNVEPLDWITSLSFLMKKISIEYKKFRPDVVLVTGDRAEMFISALTATYMNIPVAHIQAGDLSGHIDGVARHAITKLSHLHFASCKDSYNRVLKLGEQKFRVFNTGAPQLDNLINKKKINKNYIINKIGFNFYKTGYILVINHPTLANYKNALNETNILLKALEKRKEKKVVIYPNSDTGYKSIIKAIYKKKTQDFIVIKNLQRQDFIELLANTNLLIGNSSCGILEASTFKIPVINLGDRQEGRMQSKNIINSRYEKKEILKKINFVFSNKKFNKSLKKIKNPYGNGKSSIKIFNILKKINFREIIQKKMNY
tara:strand:+ start:5212 stop:6357 length:1146 start_codon:yes stop_codon:yes gene_type:complete